MIAKTESPKQVLIVDDEPYIREVAQICLETTTPWSISTADSGQACLTMAMEQQPDVILLDIMMPGLDGLSTFQKLQENEATREIPVILLTAKVQAGDRNRYEKYGITATIPKPFDPMTLPQQVAGLLNWTLEFQ